MVNALRFHEISEVTHWVMNPFNVAKIELLGEICRVRQGTKVLDLACGKGALLGIFAERFGANGVGVDIHSPFLEDARQRARELGVSDQLTFRLADAGDPTCVEGHFDVVSCIGATWIGGGLTGTLELMRRWMSPQGWLLIGECYWKEPPSAAARGRHEGGEGFEDLPGTLRRFESLELDLVEMVLASSEDWDRYAASQWLNVSDWLARNPDSPDADEIRASRDQSRRGYLTEDRRCLGWGVFVLRCPSV